MTEPKTRRRKGEGSITRHHNHATCPPAVDGVRPEHKCKGLWRARVTIRVRNKSVTKVVYGKTEPEITRKKQALEQRGSAGKVVAGKPGTVAQWIEEYYEEFKETTWATNTSQAYRSKIDCWITPHLGHLRLDRMDEDDVEEVYELMRRQGLAEGTIHQVHCILSGAMRVAKRRKRVGVNCIRDTEAPSQKPRKPRRPLTVEEARRVLVAAGDNPRAAVALMTGLRPSEALALRWNHLNLAGTPKVPRPHIVVRHSVYRQTGAGYKEKAPKSEAGDERYVLLIPELVERLLRWKALEQERGATDADYLFHAVRRREVPLNRTTDLEWWGKWLEAAGVEWTPLHAARNTTSQLLQNAGVEVGVVRAILGHANDEMTQHYQKGNTAAIIAAFDQLGDYMNDNQAGGGVVDAADFIKRSEVA